MGTPQLGPDTFADWRTPDGVRPSSASVCDGGSRISVAFPVAVKSRPGMACGSGGHYRAGETMDFNPDGTHRYGDLKLTYAPVNNALTAPAPMFGVYGPHLNGCDMRRITEFKSDLDANSRAAELARLHPGHEFFVVKRIKRYRVADVPPPMEVYNYPA